MSNLIQALEEIAKAIKGKSSSDSGSDSSDDSSVITNVHMLELVDEGDNTYSIDYGSDYSYDSFTSAYNHGMLYILYSYGDYKLYFQSHQGHKTMYTLDNMVDESYDIDVPYIEFTAASDATGTDYVRVYDPYYGDGHYTTPNFVYVEKGRYDSSEPFVVELEGDMSSESPAAPNWASTYAEGNLYEDITKALAENRPVVAQFNLASVSMLDIQAESVTFDKIPLAFVDSSAGYVFQVQYPGDNATMLYTINAIIGTIPSGERDDSGYDIYDTTLQGAVFKTALTQS